MTNTCVLFSVFSFPVFVANCVVFWAHWGTQEENDKLLGIVFNDSLEFNFVNASTGNWYVVWSIKFKFLNGHRFRSKSVRVNFVINV